MDLVLLLQLAWACAMARWVFGHGDELGRCLTSALLMWLALFAVGVAASLWIVCYVIAAVRRSMRAQKTPMGA
jgi:hypothetical protein